jgi:enoyl-CoA hydratase
MSDEATIRVDLHDEGTIAVITLTRIAKRNALNRATSVQLREAIRRLADDRVVRALIITGTEKCFAAGSDIRELRDRDVEDTLRFHPSPLFLEVEDFPHPVIAAINGMAVGGGIELAMACDIRLAVRSATFGLPELDIGTFPVAGATYRLVRIVGVGRAKELIYTGRMFGADEALAMNLVEELVDEDALLPRAFEMARRIASGSSLSVRMSKLAMNATMRGEPLEGVLEVMMTLVLNGSDERKQRMGDFLEKRGRWAKP